MRKIGKGVFVLLLFVAVGSMTACGEDNKENTTAKETIKKGDLVKANTLTELLKKYHMVTYSQLDIMNGETGYMSFYQDKLGENVKTSIWPAYEDYGTAHYLLSTQKGKMTCLVSARKQKLQDFENFFVSFGNDKKEDTAYEVTRQKDGSRMIVDKSTINKDYANQLSTSWKDVKEGDTLLLRMWIKKDSLELTRVEYSVLCKSDHMEKPMTSGVLRLFEKKDVMYGEKIKEYQKRKQHKLTIHLKDGSKRQFMIPDRIRISVECDKGERIYEKTGKKKKMKLWKCPSKGVTKEKELFCK